MKVGQIWYRTDHNELWLVIQDYSPYPEWVFETPNDDTWYVHKMLVDDFRKEGRLVYVGESGLSTDDLHD